MGIGVSFVLIAVGAVLAFAVSATGHGFNIHTIGIVLLVVGAIGALTSMISGRAGAGSAARAVRRPSSKSVRPVQPSSGPSTRLRAWGPDVDSTSVRFTIPRRSSARSESRAMLRRIVHLVVLRIRRGRRSGYVDLRRGNTDRAACSSCLRA
jgi:hypothetical protein